MAQTPSNQQVKVKLSEDPDKTLAIVGIVLAVFIPLIGLVVSIIAKVQSKKKGFSNPLATVGIILNAVITFITTLIIIGVVIFSVFMVGVFSDATKRDEQRKTDIAYLGKEIEKYVSIKGYFPQNLQDLTTLNDFNTKALKDPKGNSYFYVTTPAGCDKQSNCTSYKVFVKPEVIVDGVDELNYSNSFNR